MSKWSADTKTPVGIHRMIFNALASHPNMQITT